MDRSIADTHSESNDILTRVCARFPVRHYALYGDVAGIAELVNGSGYLFRAEGERQAVLVSYRDTELVLLGLVRLADLQRELDGDRVTRIAGY
jgi:hypothetical protein